MHAEFAEVMLLLEEASGSISAGQMEPAYDHILQAGNILENLIATHTRSLAVNSTLPVSAHRAAMAAVPHAVAAAA